MKRFLAGFISLTIAVTAPASQQAPSPVGNTPVQPPLTTAAQTASATGTTASSPLSRARKLPVVAEAMNVPINFYGKTVDQNGKPVSGVRIIYRIRQPRFDPRNIVGAAFSQNQTITAQDGTFALSGTEGDVLTFETFEKEGYVASAAFTKEFNYVGAAPFRPDVNNPVVIKLWRLTEPQALERHRLSRVGIPCDGQEVEFDLISGVKVKTGGQLKVRFWREPQVLADTRTNYYWRLSLKVADGGLLPAYDEPLFAAPAGGYQQSWEIEMPVAYTNWVPRFKQAFYIKLNGGSRYGSMLLTLSTQYNPPPVGLTLEVVTNPSGSRNLEPK